MKTFYSAEDIENFADQGQSEICVDENIVLTDLAKQTAPMLGIRITEKPSGASPGAFNPARPQSVGKSTRSAANPRDARDGRRRNRHRRPGRRPGNPGQVVDKLVEKIKRINGNNG